MSSVAPAGPSPGVDAILKSLVIPSCPEVLTDLHAEMRKEDPDPQRIARLVGADVALSVAVLRTINSPFYGLSRPVDSIAQAVAMLGLRQLASLVSAILLRQAAAFKGLNLVRFWDVSNKRSFAMMKLARGLKGVDPDMAQSFGLFCDIGIPLLMQRFPDYGSTLKLANEAEDRPFTDVEFEHHGISHTQVGSLMARSWGLNDTLCLAIRRHHDYALFQEPGVPDPVVRLVAMCLVADLAIQRFARLNAGSEWHKGGDSAVGALMLSDLDLEDWIETLGEGFSRELD